MSSNTKNDNKRKKITTNIKPDYPEPDYEPDYPEPDYEPDYPEPDYEPDYPEPDYEPDYPEPDYEPRARGESVQHSVDNPPGKIKSRVFIAGNYDLMPVLRFIKNIVSWLGYQPIIAYDFEMPRKETRDYTLRLLSSCRYAIFEMTLPNGHLVEYTRANLIQIEMLQVYMAIDERKEKPNSLSIMVWQTEPPPQGYCTFQELKEVIVAFLGPYIENESKS